MKLSRLSNGTITFLVVVCFAFGLIFPVLASELSFSPAFMMLTVLLTQVSIVFGIFLLVYLFMRSHQKQSRPAAPPAAEKIRKPPLPQKKAAEKTDPAYQKRLDILRKLSSEMISRQNSISGFLKDYFQNSLISISRYESVMQDATEVLQDNYEKASQAVSMFGSAPATPDRLRILDGYVSDSRDTVQKMETIFDELIKVQQKRSFEDADSLDEMLDSLASTTRAYH